jgi:PTH2 family peptidyl-tRNA hydrolase
METHRDYKQVIVMRKDLNMRKGKMVAQGAHASVAAILDRETGQVKDDERIRAWLAGNFAKICVSVETEPELVTLYNRVQDAGLPCAMITDSGRTEFHNVETRTCIAVGPALIADVDEFTKDLKLL